MDPLKILFMGSPAIAVPALETLLSSGDRVVGVVTQPDRPAGRGREVTSPAVALLAREKGLPLFQPATLKGNAEFLQSLKDLPLDLIVVAAYGKIIPREVLELPRLRSVNVHFSLLPKYRGAAPVQWALIHDETETGATTFFITEKVDAGPILLQKKVPIEPEDNAEILGHRLAVVGAELLRETIDGLKQGGIDPIPQNERLASLAPVLKKEDGRIDWNRKAETLLNQIRGMTPWPGTFTFLGDKRLKIHRAEVTPGKRSAPPGEVIASGPLGLEVACRQGALLLKEVQLEGGKKMEAAEFVKGHPITQGGKLGG